MLTPSLQSFPSNNNHLTRNWLASQVKKGISSTVFLDEADMKEGDMLLNVTFTNQINIPVEMTRHLNCLNNSICVKPGSTANSVFKRNHCDITLKLRFCQATCTASRQGICNGKNHFSLGSFRIGVCENKSHTWGIRTRIKRSDCPWENMACNALIVLLL